MFKLNLKIAFRNLWKNKGYSFINILGLSIGMASCILIFIFVHYQTSFDEHFAHKDRIYRVVTNWEYLAGTDASSGVPMPLANAIRQDISQLEMVAAMQSTQGVIMVKNQNGEVMIKEASSAQFVQPQFFDIFKFSWRSTKPNLVAPNTVAISEEKAVKYFGNWQKAIGKSILLNNRTLLKVTGVFQTPPANTTLPIHVAISYATYANRDSKNWGSVNSSSECYVLVKEGVSSADLNLPIGQFTNRYEDKNATGKQFYTFQPLPEIHHQERYGNIAGATIAKKEIYGLLVIAAFLLITACINFINLATAQAVNRSKEVGVRKVMGSRRQQLLTQFLLETLTITLLALFVAGILAEMALPYLEQLFREKLAFSLFDQPVIFVFMLGLVVVVTFLAGFYPALVMSGFNPALALKNKVTANASGLSLRKVLVIVQFAITVILIIGTLVILSQMDYLREKPLGFDSTAVSMVDVPGDSTSKKKYETFKTQLLAMKEVQLVSFCQAPPSSNNIMENTFSYHGQENKDFAVRVSAADENYFKLFDLNVLAGKIYRKSDTISGYVVNETFLKKMYITNPQDAIGKELNQSGQKALIVGVIQDFNDKSLKESISPLAIYPAKSEYYTLAIKMNLKEMMPAMKKIERLWNNTFPNHIYNASMVNDNINNYYESERIMGVLFKLFAIIIIFISFIGLFGLISFVATQRTREVAIRKVLGASTFELVRLLNGSFLKMVFIANLIAWPLAYVFASTWLSAFTYRIELTLWPFIIAMLISMLVTLLTVSLRSYRAAVSNSINALKYE
jgi:putative ABC transport system permease protein